MICTLHHSHPLTTPSEVEARILASSLEHPARGCNRLGDHLALEGISARAPTNQRILNGNGMGTRYDCWLKLKQRHAQQAVELTAEQVQFIEKQKPAF